MNVFLGLIERMVSALNQASFWRRECVVWDQKMSGTTFERWLYLHMHRFGRMGSDERVALSRLVQPSMTIVEVGGNLGLYTVLLSRLVGPSGRIITFEPDPDLYAMLQRNCRINGCTNVEMHQLAAGSCAARLVLQKLILNSGDNHLGEGGSKLFRRNVETEVVAIDKFLPKLRPDLIKIDVQGWEYEVLIGLSEILESNPETNIYLELWPSGLRRAGCSVEVLTHWLRDRGYRLYNTSNSKALKDEDLKALSRELTGLKHTDLFVTQGEHFFADTDQ